MSKSSGGASWLSKNRIYSCNRKIMISLLPPPPPCLCCSAMPLIFLTQKHIKAKGANDNSSTSYILMCYDQGYYLVSFFKKHDLILEHWKSFHIEPIYRYCYRLNYKEFAVSKAQSAVLHPRNRHIWIWNEGCVLEKKKLVKWHFSV